MRRLGDTHVEIRRARPSAKADEIGSACQMHADELPSLLGGDISPLLLNIALHGLEEAAGVRYRTGVHAGDVRDGCPALTRYADDLVVCCHSRQQAEQVKARLAGWLEPRGLAFNEAKTRIVPLSEGFD